MKKLPLVIVLGLLLVLLSGCGFKLRGALSLPVDIGPIEVVSRDPYSALANSLAVSLERQSGYAEVVQRGTGGLATLNIISERWALNPISVDQFGRAREYNLRYAVFFDFRDATGQVLVPEQGLELARDYTSSAAVAMGTTSERELLETELRRDMTAAVLRRMDTVLKLPQAAPAVTNEL